MEEGGAGISLLRPSCLQEYDVRALGSFDREEANCRGTNGEPEETEEGCKEERRVGNEGLNEGIRTSQRRKFNLLPAWRPFLVIMLVEARLSSTPVHGDVYRGPLCGFPFLLSLSLTLSLSLSLSLSSSRSFSLTTRRAADRRIAPRRQRKNAIRVRDVPFCRHRRDSNEVIRTGTP